MQARGPHFPMAALSETEAKALPNSAGGGVVAPQHGAAPLPRALSERPSPKGADPRAGQGPDVRIRHLDPACAEGAHDGNRRMKAHGDAPPDLAPAGLKMALQPPGTLGLQRTISLDFGEPVEVFTRRSNCWCRGEIEAVQADGNILVTWFAAGQRWQKVVNPNDRSVVRGRARTPRECEGKVSRLEKSIIALRLEKEQLKSALQKSEAARPRDRNPSLDGSAPPEPAAELSQIGQLFCKGGQSPDDAPGHADKSGEVKVPGEHQETAKHSQIDATGEGEREELRRWVWSALVPPPPGRSACCFDQDVKRRAAFESVVTILTEGLIGPQGSVGIGHLQRHPDDAAARLAAQVDDATLGRALRGVVQTALEALAAVRAPDRARARKADEFRFGDIKTFDDGVSGLVGPPINVAGGSIPFTTQFIKAMEAEHTAVPDTEWGGSNQKFEPPPRYSWQTCPYSEWRFVLPESDSDYREEFAGHTVDGSVEFRKPLKLHEDRVDYSSTAPPLRPHPDTARRIYDALAKITPAEHFGFADTESSENDFSAFQRIFGKLCLNVPELVAMRLHTGPMFVFYNTVLRARGGTVDWESPAKRYPIQFNANVAGKFVTTIHSIASGVLKLSHLQPAVTVYRGAGGFKMPAALRKPDAFGSRFGTEYGFLSTTMDPAVAREYGVDWDRRRGLNYLFEMQMDAANRGASLMWLSQFPTECEVLFPPLVVLQVIGEPQYKADQLHYQFRLTCNQRIASIELLVRRRKVLHELTLANLQAELRTVDVGLSSVGQPMPLPSELLKKFERHVDLVKKLQETDFNEDHFYSRLFNAGVELKRLLAAVGKEFLCECIQKKISHASQKAQSLLWFFITERKNQGLRGQTGGGDIDSLATVNGELLRRIGIRSTTTSKWAAVRSSIGAVAGRQAKSAAMIDLRRERHVSAGEQDLLMRQQATSYNRKDWQTATSSGQAVLGVVAETAAEGGDGRTAGAASLQVTAAQADALDLEAVHSDPLDITLNIPSAMSEHEALPSAVDAAPLLMPRAFSCRERPSPTEQ